MESFEWIPTIWSEQLWLDTARAFFHRQQNRLKQESCNLEKQWLDLLYKASGGNLNPIFLVSKFSVYEIPESRCYIRVKFKFSFGEGINVTYIECFVNTTDQVLSDVRYHIAGMVIDELHKQRKEFYQ